MEVIRRMLVSLFIAGSVLAATGSIAADLQLAVEQPTLVGSLDAGSEVAKASYNSNIYIVQLTEPTVASYHGGIADLAATSNQATGAKILDTNSAPSQAYAKYLLNKQSEFIAECELAIGHTLNVTFDYQHVFNGIAVERDV